MKVCVVFVIHMVAAELVKGGNKRFVVLGLGGDGGVRGGGQSGCKTQAIGAICVTWWIVSSKVHSGAAFGEIVVSEELNAFCEVAEIVFPMDCAGDLSMEFHRV